MTRVAFAIVLLAGLVALLLPAVEACPPAYVSSSYGGYSSYSSYSSAYVAQPYVAPVVKVKEVIIGSYFALPVFIPTYTAGYVASPSAAITAPAAALQQPASACSEDIRLLKQQLEQLRQQLAPPAPVKPADPFYPTPQRVSGDSTAHNVGSVFGSRCSRCHEAATASAKGGGFVLIQNGALAPLKERQVMRIATQTALKKMPPGAPLSDGEMIAVQEWADSSK